MYTQARRAHVNTLLLIRKFWRLLLDKSGVDLGKLSTLSGKIGESEKRALDSYEVLLQQHGESPRIVRDYARFIEEVVQDPLLAQRLYSKADRLEEKETAAHSNAHSSRVKGTHDTEDEETKDQIKEEEHGRRKSDMTNPENYYNQLINTLGFSSESILGTEEMEKAWNQSIEGGGTDIKISEDDESLSKSDDGTHYSEDSEASSSVLDVERNRAKLTAGQQNGPLRWLSWSMILTVIISLAIALGSLIGMVSSIEGTRNMLDLLNGAGNLGQFALQIGLLSSYLQTQGYTTITTGTFAVSGNSMNVTFKPAQVEAFDNIRDEIRHVSYTMLNIFEAMYYGVDDRAPFYTTEFLLLREQIGDEAPKLDISEKPLPTTFFNKHTHLSKPVFDLMENPSLKPTIAINSPLNASNPQSALKVDLYPMNMGLWTLVNMFSSFVDDYIDINPNEVFALYVLSGGPTVSAAAQNALWKGVGSDINSIYRGWRFILDNAPVTIHDSMMVYGELTVDQFHTSNNDVVNLITASFIIFSSIQFLLIVFLFRPVVIRIGQHKLTTLNLFVLIPRKIVKKLANKKISGITKNTEKMGVNNRPTTTNEKIETEDESDRDDDSDNEHGKSDMKLEDVKSENESEMEQLDFVDEAGVNNLSESNANVQRQSNLLGTSIAIPNPNFITSNNSSSNVNNNNNSNSINNNTGSNHSSSGNLNLKAEIVIDIPKLKKSASETPKSKLVEITDSVRQKISRSKSTPVEKVSEGDGVGADSISPISSDSTDRTTPGHRTPTPQEKNDSRFKILLKWLRGAGNKVTPGSSQKESTNDLSDKAKEESRLSKVRYSKSLIAINRSLHMRYGVMMFLIFGIFLVWALVAVFGFQKLQPIGQTMIGHEDCLTLVRKVQFYGSMITSGLYRGNEMSTIVTDLGTTLGQLNSEFEAARSLTEQLGYQSEFAGNKYYKQYVANMYSDTCAEHVVAQQAAHCRNETDEKFYGITSQGLAFMMLNFVELGSTFYETSAAALATLAAQNQTLPNMKALVPATNLDYTMMNTMGDTDLYYSLEFSNFVVYMIWYSELQDLQTKLGLVAAAQCILILGLYIVLFRPFLNKLKNESAHSYVMLRLIPKEQIEKIAEIKKFLNAGVLKEEEEIVI
eukprot:TRINITY_DN4782_c0_g1_i3.p1 TRINITY_DN4782_c0_g1~~TRINITY_DN4782_c0_g1_i3.p1  ORF type:complete len:1291 (-),score=264.30 TRINITY_DN4782_c0_g1_i3:223-3642(-)